MRPARLRVCPGRNCPTDRRTVSALSFPRRRLTPASDKDRYHRLFRFSLPSFEINSLLCSCSQLRTSPARSPPVWQVSHQEKHSSLSAALRSEEHTSELQSPT